MYTSIYFLCPSSNVLFCRQLCILGFYRLLSYYSLLALFNNNDSSKETFCVKIQFNIGTFIQFYSFEIQNICSKNINLYPYQRYWNVFIIAIQFFSSITCLLFVSGIFSILCLGGTKYIPLTKLWQVNFNIVMLLNM